MFKVYKRYEYDNPLSFSNNWYIIVQNSLSQTRRTEGFFSKMQFLHFCPLQGQVKPERWCQSWQVLYNTDAVGAWQASV